VAVAVVHPGEMGAAVGAALVASGHEVLWASAGRSEATLERAERAGLADAVTLDAAARRSNVVLSICPPHAALDVARELAGFTGLYVDANAVSPETAAAVAEVVEAGGATYVDGGIVGGPPRDAGTTRLYLSGASAGRVAALFDGSVLDARVVFGGPTSASAVKMAYAAWTKGTNAMLLAIRALARRLEVEEPLLAEWALSQPELPARSDAAAASASAKAWRWIGEMEEIARTFAGAGLPDGFHAAAAEVYARLPRGLEPGDDQLLDQLLDRLVVSGT
jgi:3-hydroxyisobutyrate dehydrogenase-like beta-hydroxyacid dehydrogenase